MHSMKCLMNLKNACIQKMDSEDKEVICLGDFNCDWFQLTTSSVTKKLFELTEVYQLQQIIEEPTQITSNSQTHIDLVFTNRPEIIIKSGVDHIGF